MKVSRIAFAIAALPLLAVACDRAPTALDAPPTVRRETDPTPPPEPVKRDSTSDGGGVKGGGG
jgi:hypothetical protein